MKVRLEVKWRTKDCDGCHCCDDDICLWGVRDKKLVHSFASGGEHKPKHCEYIGKPPMRSEIVRHESYGRHEIEEKIPRQIIMQI